MKWNRMIFYEINVFAIFNKNRLHVLLRFFFYQALITMCGTHKKHSSSFPDAPRLWYSRLPRPISLIRCQLQ